METQSVSGPVRTAVVTAQVAWPRLALAGLVAAGAAWAAVLLARFPYDGLYGQDAYAYYGQAEALWRELTGQPPIPGGLYSSNGLYHWPIGYHLHLMLGFLLGGPGPGAGRAITLLMTVLTPVLIALLVGALWTAAPLRPRVAAGLIAGGALLLCGTYMRMGLSIMADVPALFWSTLAVLCGLRAWPSDPATEPAPPRCQIAWATAGGIALGLAVLTRYGAALLLGPALLYLLLRYLAARHNQSRIQDLPLRAAKGPQSKIVWAMLGFAVALVPQATYLLTHDPGPGASEWLAGWNLSNLFARTVTSVDGTATFNQPMLVFYLIEPLRGAAAGFLPAFYLPALVLGIAWLVREGRWPVLGLLASWWLGMAVFYSATPYQSQRFVLAYLPALLVAVGIGGAIAGEWAVRQLREQRTARSLTAGGTGLLILFGLATGAWQGQQSVRDWIATHAGWKVEEQQVIALAREAAGPISPTTPPHIIAFGTTAALDYYTGWPVRDLYNLDEPAVAAFFAAPGPRLLVIPESNLATQWAATPLAARWDWVRAHYVLTSRGQAVGFTVYTVESIRSVGR